MNNKLFLIIPILFMLSISSAFAIQLNSLYQGDVGVATQSNEEKAKAIPEALAQVFSKVSGNSNILENPTLRSSLSTAESLVQELSYSPATLPNQGAYILHVQFDAEGVNQILRKADVPIWGQNRPLIMVWLDDEKPNKAAEIVESDSSHLICSLLKQYAEARGLAVILPTMDMTDLNQVTIDDVRKPNLTTLLNASKRYASEVLLVLRVIENADGITLKSQMMLGKDQWAWDFSAKSLESVMAGLLNTVSQTLANRYATVISNRVESQLTLQVTNISQQDDLAQLMDYLEHLTTVADVEPLHINGDNVILKISLRGSEEAFIKSLSVGQKLQSQTSTDVNTLIYQWTP